MRRLNCLVPLLLAALPAAAQAPINARAAGAPATVLVIPFARFADTPEWLSFALAEGITDVIAQTGKDNFLSLKQLDAVLRRRDLLLGDVSDPEVALPLARALGATDVVIGELRQVGPRVLVRARRLSVTTRRTVRKATAEVARRELPLLAVRLAAALLGTDPKAWPLTESPKAFEQGARCALEVIRQPLGPHAPMTLRLAALEEAESSCRGAVTSDPGFGLARAGLAVVLAARGDAARAREEAAAAHGQRFVALAYLIESYAARLLKDDVGAAALLERAVSERPGFLHALGYLGEARLSSRDAAGAVAVFERYLARAPNHPWALAMKGKALARLGRFEESLAATRQALAVNPGNPELLIELASRLIDAGRDAQAEAPLREALTAYPVRPAAHLRLGYVFLRQKNAAEARDQLSRALTEAWREDESRIRGYAHADLARVAGLENDLEGAVAHLEAARAEGSPRRLPCHESELDAFRGKPDFDRLCGAPR